MNVNVENLENSLAKITVSIPAEDLAQAVKTVYDRQKGRFSVPGFRKGHVPKSIIEKYYGEGIFFEDAANDLINRTYEDARTESGLDVVSRPEIALDSISTEEGMVYTATVAVRPPVTLGQYKGLTVAKADQEVAEDAVENSIQQERERNGRLVSVERPVQSGDTVDIDFLGTVDGVAFDGGKGENYPLEIGSGSFIPGFEDQIIGHQVKDSFDVNVTFPEDYHAEELKGKAAVFAVTVNEIKEKQLPDLDDEFASEVSEFDTLEEYRADVRRKLQEQAEQTTKTMNENAALDAVIANAQVEIPDLMTETRIDSMVDEYTNQMSSYGFTLDQYLKMSGMTMEQLRESMKEQAVSNLKGSLVLGAVADAENLSVSEEDIDAEISKMAETYSMEADKVKELLGEQGLKNVSDDLRVQKAIEFIVANTIFE